MCATASGPVHPGRGTSYDTRDHQLLPVQPAAEQPKPALLPAVQTARLRAVPSAPHISGCGSEFGHGEQLNFFML